MRLQVKTPNRTFEYEAPEGKSSLVIGNRAGDDLYIDDDRGLSGPHTRLELVGGLWSFSDQMSDKGTIFNGDLQPSGNLKVGDVLQLADTRIEVLPEDAPHAPVPTQSETALAAELFMALASCCAKSKANSHLTASQRERELRELAQKAVAKGPPERVLHIWLPLALEGDGLFYEIEEDINGEGEIDEDDLTPEEKDIADFIMRRFGEKSRVDIRADCLARTRVAWAAEDAADELKEQGYTEVSLPYLGATARGPEHFCAKIEQEGMRLVLRDWLPYKPPTPEGTPAGDELYAALEARFKADHKRAYLNDDAKRAVASVTKKMRDTLSPDMLREKVLPMLRGETPHDDARDRVRKLNEEIDAEMKAAAAGEDKLNERAIEYFKKQTGIDIHDDEKARERLRDELRVAYTLSRVGEECDVHVSALAKNTSGWQDLHFVLIAGEITEPQVEAPPPPPSTLTKVLQWIVAILIIAGTIFVMYLLDM